MDKRYIVTKSNKLISANYDLSLQEQKIILTLASMVQPDDAELKEYEFKIKDFINLLDIEDKKKYIEIPKITKELMKKVLEIKEGKEIIQLSWLSSARYKIGQGIVILKFDSNLKPYLLQLKELYTSYKLENILSLKSKYSIRLYEILRSNLFKNQVSISIKDIKEMVGAKGKSYDVYANFKNKVILQAQKEINTKTDIKFEFEEIKTGRKVTSICFYITSTKNKTEDVIAATLDKNNSISNINRNGIDLISEVQKIFLKHKINDYEAECILKKSTDLKHIKECYRYALTQNVDNIMAYMLSLIDNFNKPQVNIKQDKFTDYEQRNYNFDELEKKLLGQY